jgi:signal transduction histidine kinase
MLRATAFGHILVSVQLARLLPSAAWEYLTSLNRILPALLSALTLFASTTYVFGAEGDRPRRVLMVHSFGSSAPPFTTHSTAFEAAIKRELGTDAVDLDEVSLAMARYAQPDMEEAFAEFLGKRMSTWQPDLVVPIGSPAGKFVAKYRDRLFPRAPVVYTGMDRRTLPPDAFANNATFVGENFDLKGLVEDVLQLDPETKNVFVILGATPLERYWAVEFQKAFEPFAGRIKFTWSNDLSFEQILDVASKLPPHSFVLLGLFMRDASGVTYNADAALARLNAVSRAPVNGIFQHQVGLGIVGGRLYQGELEGVEGARVAARILRGEPASSIPPLVIGTREPTYDWRELRRWGFGESRLPPGSVVLFRQPTTWERYRWQIIGAAAVIATQAMLILALLVQLRRRRVAEGATRRAEREVLQKRAELAHFSRVATLGELSTALAHEIKQPLAAILMNSAAGIDLLAQTEPDLQEVREALSDIYDDTRRADEVIRRLRDLLRRDTPGFANLDLNDLIRGVERIVRSDASQHGVAVQLDLSPRPVPVNGDSVQLQQVMLNVMLNALGAMNERERVARRLIVRTSVVKRSAANGDSAIASDALIEVQDSGTGIAPDQLETIFDPFVTTKPDGLGMGLAICRSIIERHRGTIRAANNPDRGATFCVTLPLQSEADLHVTPRQSEPLAEFAA